MMMMMMVDGFCAKDGKRKMSSDKFICHILSIFLEIQ